MNSFPSIEIVSGRVPPRRKIGNLLDSDRKLKSGDRQMEFDHHEHRFLHVVR
uniref:Uncharacterized protein n=1 Tax=Picea glauca TaxID=3330 RepID=A0A101LZF8_PICGL|nr:hypothetical protein ABT39_MTgene5206 [Picea glauca]